MGELWLVAVAPGGTLGHETTSRPSFMAADIVLIYRTRSILYRMTGRTSQKLTIVPFGTCSTRSNLPYLISCAVYFTPLLWSEGILGCLSPEMTRTSLLSRCTLTSSDFMPGSSSVAVMREEDGSSHNSSLLNDQRAKQMGLGEPAYLGL